MAPAIPSWLNKRSLSQAANSAWGPLVEASHDLLARDGKDDDHDNKKQNPASGVLDPHDISNVGFFILFALIGVAFVITIIWFFFWAKNGGFYFKENDWEDYKTTVLRRKGPNGTILSNATPSTNLGGGSVYKDMDDDNTTAITESTALSGITAGASDIGAREKRRQKQEQRERERQRERRKKRGSKRHVGEDGVEDDVAEKTARDELRQYRHEKAARVGGINKQSEGSNWDGSTNPSESTVSSELLSNRQETPTGTPTGTPTKKSTPSGNGGIRKVYSTADRNVDRESERIRAEARRLREEGRSARRDFSYQRSTGTGSELSGQSQSLLEGSDVGTKSYHHPMPELREAREARQKEREERRARRGGYRRGRGDDEDM